VRQRLRSREHSSVRQYVPRFWMSSRCLRETHNEEQAASAERRAAKDIFAKQSHFMGGANKELVADTAS